MSEDYTTEVKEVDSKVQEIVNTPPADPTGWSEGVEEFIQTLMKRVFDPSDPLDLYKPESLLNTAVYEKASPEIQGKADMTAVSFCAKLRELKDLMAISGGDQLHIEPTYQAHALVEDLKYRKEEFEKNYGDLFLI